MPYGSQNCSKYDHLLAGPNFAASAARRFILGRASDLFALILRLLAVIFLLEISKLIYKFLWKEIESIL
jgi:hypothetical protein